MAIIDYLGIETAIKNILEADSRTSSYTVEIEPPDEIRTDACPYIAIYLDSYDTPLNDELIGGTKPFRTFLNIEVWCYDFSLENLAGASARDTLLGNVKEVLKENRTISDTVLVTAFTGGDFDNQKNTSGLGFFKGVSVKIQCEVRE
jgi:hypothetical protein|tara:strand:- start:337 stop:777 length:441 start_codon:yes stop_codon:yes gene_type:complete